MKKIYIFILLLTGMSQLVFASRKDDADKAYQENNFVKAIELYQSVLSVEGESAAIYYNLGNSYYKSDSIAKAILNYERALILAPNDDEISFNLEMAKSKTIDKITPKSEIFIVSWFNSLTALMNESGWAQFAIFSFIILLLGLAAYIFSKKVAVKKIGFTIAVVCFIFTIFANIFAQSQKDTLIIRNTAIVMEPTVTVRSTPNESGTELFVLHEGSKVLILDDTMNSWKEISLEDGNRGWIQTEMIEVI